MNGSRRSASFAPSENAGVVKNAPGEAGNATSLPPRTMKRVDATALASRRWSRMPRRSSSALMSGVVSSVLFGPASVSAPSRRRVAITPPAEGAASSTSTETPRSLR